MSRKKGMDGNGQPPTGRRVLPAQSISIILATLLAAVAAPRAAGA
jgi:hypothetical protein